MELWNYVEPKGFVESIRPAPMWSQRVRGGTCQPACILTTVRSADLDFTDFTDFTGKLQALWPAWQHRKPCGNAPPFHASTRECVPKKELQAKWQTQL